MTFAVPFIIATVVLACLVWYLKAQLGRLRDDHRRVLDGIWGDRTPPAMHRIDWQETQFEPMDRELELTLIGLLQAVCLWGRSNSCGSQAAAMDFTAMCDELHNVPEWLASRDASKERQFMAHFEKMDRPWARMLKDREHPGSWHQNDEEFAQSQRGQA